MRETLMQKPDRPILLFDGVCNLCNGFVRFLIERDPDPEGRFLFASLQSVPGRELLRKFGLPEEELRSFVFVDGDECHIKSTAALKTLRLLPWPWKLGYALILVPKPIRDSAYDLIAKNRYRIFGHRETCMVPTPDLKARFLE
jgi:predicted DCC family thiol-disulfide oxidoreductase YuxK